MTCFGFAQLRQPAQERLLRGGWSVQGPSPATALRPGRRLKVCWQPARAAVGHQLTCSSADRRSSRSRCSWSLRGGQEHEGPPGRSRAPAWASCSFFVNLASTALRHVHDSTDIFSSSATFLHWPAPHSRRPERLPGRRGEVAPDLAGSQGVDVADVAARLYLLALVGGGRRDNLLGVRSPLPTAATAALGG